MKNTRTFMVFDVESIGLQGEGYSVGWLVIDPQGTILEEGVASCHPKFASGNYDAHNWALANAMPSQSRHGSPYSVRHVFWEAWTHWREKEALLAAECAWPVEARFLLDCIRDNPHAREWEGPYPLIDIASVMLAKGMDPLKGYDRLLNELPTHDPLCDARQSARLLRMALLL